jgi:glycosyltransferase involved in cell wall biosynthesis
LIKVAFIVSHPIQYYAPLYRRLEKRDDLAIKVFFTWHSGNKAVHDRGFGKEFAWDIPLTDGYDFESVPNTARTPGTHHFWGLRNPSLVQTVLDWKPDAVHVTGYAYASHLFALRALHQRGVPTLFRGDSHLLDGSGTSWRWMLKRSLLKAIFKWPSAFLFVGKANREYYRAFGVPESKLFYCPHSIETERFTHLEAEFERQAGVWRKEIGIGANQKVLLFAGKFEDKKRPLPLMRAMLDFPDKNVTLIMVGDGECGPEVRRLAEKYPERFRVLPFQNQSRMPLAYRLGDMIVLPSAYGETWGLAVNEAMACGRPILASDKVGCQKDVIQQGVNGDVFKTGDWADFRQKLAALFREDWIGRRKEIISWSQNWTIEKTEATLAVALKQLTGKN